MITLIKNAKLYQPEFAGVKDILVLDGKIAAISEHIDIQVSGTLNPETDVEVMDAAGKLVVPGFVDSHVHILGGGGEGGFHTRTPEITLTGLTMAGITTVVGCLGTDGLTRNMMSLLAKARGLEEEGITTYIYTGSYQVPVRTLTGDVMKDIIAIDKIIGAGEIAISDHRSSQPTYEEFIKLAADVRVAGMLSGKGGVIDIHLGDGSRMLDLLFRATKETEIPMKHFVPTHVNRNGELFDQCVEYAKIGGFIDLTGSDDPDFWEDQDGEVRVCKAIRRFVDEGVPLDNFGLSSDAQGSLPIFNKNKELVGLTVGKATCLIREIQECVLKEGLALELVLRAVTANPARILGLKAKGHAKVGYDADLCFLTEDTLAIDTVLAKGKVMVRDGKPVVLGTFE